MTTKSDLVGSGVAASLTALAAAFILPHIQQEEGTTVVPYADVGGVLSVCYGHTGPDVVAKKVYSPSQCREIIQQDVDTVEKGILKVSPQLKYHPMQLAAAISFTYNVGVGAYDRSSVMTNFNKGNYIGGCQALLKYVYAGGKYSAGIYNRRKKEYAICMSTLTPGGLSNVDTTT
jgi:lysozyme